MGEELSEEELLERAEQPGEDALKLHPFYQGKVQTNPKCAIRGFDDFAIWYTPGVAKPCEEIAEEPSKVFNNTNKGNMVAVVSDGSRVLGLGNIGPEAGLPVMEGKSLLFKYLGGIDAFPITLDTEDPQEIIQTVKILQPSFGGINLEDISNPKCFRILDRLRKDMDIPVWHDDQQGTAAIELAGIKNALHIVDKDLENVRYAIIGAGAANIALTRVMFTAGVPPENVFMADSSGLLHENREDLYENRKQNPYKWKLAQKTNGPSRTGGLEEAIRGTDVLVAASTPGPGVIKQEWISQMNEDSVVFAVANPIPEIWPWKAKEAGAEIVGTGRSDFPNQINNSIGFPGIFRGTLDVNARTITDEMAIAAADAIAKTAREKGLNKDYVVPTMDQWEVFINQAVAVGRKAVEQGIARKEPSAKELEKMARERIKKARQWTQQAMESGLIDNPPD